MLETLPQHHLTNTIRDLSEDKGTQLESFTDESGTIKVCYYLYGSVIHVTVGQSGLDVKNVVGDAYDIIRARHPHVFNK